MIKCLADAADYFSKRRTPTTALVNGEERKVSSYIQCKQLYDKGKSINFHTMKKDELIALALDMELEVPKKITKKQIIDLIVAQEK